MFDSENPEYFITLRLFESNSEAIIEHVSFVFELRKDGQEIFKQLFHDELGNLNLKIISNSSEEITILGDKEEILGGWMRGSESLIMKGPIFRSGGLYEYKIEILTIDSDTNILNTPIILEGAISLADTKIFDVLDSQNQNQPMQVISYFDSIEDFSFDSKQVNLTIPFDWSQDFEQLSVVHEEIRIPNTFGEFLSTKYNASVNGVALPEDSITIDDYSFEDRTTHIVVNQELLKQIRDDASLVSDSKMHFVLQPSDEVVFPLEFVTPDLIYKVFLSWEPEIIRSGSETTFFVGLQEIFSDKTKKLVEYDLSIMQNESEIFKKSLVGNVNSEKPNSHKIKFDLENSGTANLVLSDIGGHFLSKGNFIIVIHPPDDFSTYETLNNKMIIPQWIKTNASWWVEDKIDDSTFVQGIQFLIKQKILFVSPTQSDNSNLEEIPQWIKTNTSWWVEDKIDDSTFVQGIQFLIKNGIIVV